MQKRSASSLVAPKATEVLLNISIRGATCKYRMVPGISFGN